MKFKEYKMPDGRKAVFEYDENGVGKITLECMDMLMGLINDRKTENNSEKPNNCEHIVEDGVTCAKYPACDDCLDNPLNKVKGSERLVKGSEKPNNWEDFFRELTAEERKAVADYIDSISVPTGVNIFDLMDNSTISKMEQVDEDINVRSKDEPQTENLFTDKYGDVWEWRGDAWYCISEQDEPQTDCAWK